MAFKNSSGIANLDLQDPMISILSVNADCDWLLLQTWLLLQEVSISASARSLSQDILVVATSIGIPALAVSSQAYFRLHCCFAGIWMAGSPAGEEHLPAC